MAKWDRDITLDKEPVQQPKWTQDLTPETDEVQLTPKTEPLVPQDTQEGELKPQGKPEGLTKKSALPHMGFGPKYEPMDVPDIAGLGVRGLKDFVNVVPETIKEVGYGISGGRFATRIAASKLHKKMSERDLPEGFELPSKKELRKAIKAKTLASTGLPQFEVKPATNLAEKVVDVASGLAKFVTKLAVLKKASPQASGGALWEMENLSSGGIPGMGYAMHAVFADTGRMIPGKGKIAGTARLGLQSTGLAGLSALEQKIDTGEIDYKQVGIAAGLPLALRTAKAIKSLIKAKNPKVMKAVAETHPEILKFKVPPEVQKKIETIKTANATVESWVGKAKVINESVRKEARHKLRQAQHAKFSKAYKKERAKGTSVFQSAKIAKKARGGRMGNMEVEPLKLSQAQKDVYGNRIERAYSEKQGFQRAGAVGAIEKMENGLIPTNYEFGLLEPVLGTKTTTKLYTALKGKRHLEWTDIPELVRDIPKAVRFGFDPQAARGLSKISVRHPLIYLKGLYHNIRGMFSQSYTNKTQAALEKSPAWELGNKEYGINQLSIKPWATVSTRKKLEQFGNVSDVFLRSESKLFKGVGRWLKGAERGAALGMNSAFNKMVIKGEKDLARYARSKTLSKAEVSAWRKRRGHVINIFTKRVSAKHPKMKEVQRAANWLVFSPAYTASGIVAAPHSVGKLITGKGFADKTYGMTLLLSRLAGLATVSTAIGYAGYKKRLANPTEEPNIDSSANPLDPLWGKVRTGEEVYDLGFGDISEYRLLAQIGFSAHMATKEAITGKMATTTVGGKKPPTAGEAISRYLNAKRTLYLSLAKQLATGKDWLGNPVTLKDTALDNIPFEFLQAFVEAGEADGTWETMEEGFSLETAKKSLDNFTPAIAALGGFGTGSYPVHTATTRAKFRNVIAKQTYDKKWDELKQNEQGKLKADHRKQFAAFEEKIKRERVDIPFSLEKIQKEEREASTRVRKLLPKKAQSLYKEINLGISRRPKDFYLSDARYNRYQELIVQYMQDRLETVDISKEDTIIRTKRLKIILTNAKNRAFATLRSEIDGR